MAGADLDLGPDRSLPGRPGDLRAVPATTGRHRQPGGSALNAGRAGAHHGNPSRHAAARLPRHADQNADRHAETDASHQFGIPDPEATPDRRFDAIAVGHGDTDSLGGPLGVSLDGPSLRRGGGPARHHRAAAGRPTRQRNRLMFGPACAPVNWSPAKPPRAAVQALTGAAAQIGLAGEDGPRAVAATIRSGFHRAGQRISPLTTRQDHRQAQARRPAKTGWSDAQPRFWGAAENISERSSPPRKRASCL